MPNILWQRPDGTLAITYPADDETPMNELATQLLDAGAIPPDWQPVRFDVTLPAPEIDQCELVKGNLVAKPPKADDETQQTQ
jgi:hypothetical protein